MYLNIVNPTIHTQVKDLKTFPLLFPKEKDYEYIAKKNILIFRDDWDSYETSWDFKKHPLV